MKHYLNIVTICFCCLIFTIPCSAQAPAIQWQKSFGGTGHDMASDVKQTKDGGYIMVGSVSSSDGDVIGNHGAIDVWVLKLDANGKLQWKKCYGGSSGEAACSIQLTKDGGYIFAGNTGSNDGDVSGLHLHNPQYGDCWIVKIDSIGNILWQKCYGGTYYENAESIMQTNDGGYIFTGNTNSNDGDVSGLHSNNGGYSDYWVVKIDSIGNILWQKCLGGTNNDNAFDIQQTTDRGYIVVGRALSNDGDVTGHQGGTFMANYWIVKLDSLGKIQWQKALGGSNGSAEAWSVKQNVDGNYVIAGFTTFTDGDVKNNSGGSCDWVIILNTTGDIIFNQCYGSGSAQAYNVALTNDKGYVITGISDGGSWEVTGNHGGSQDYWILKLDSSGSIVWEQCYGGSQTEGIDKVFFLQTTDGGGIFAGSSNSNDGDVSGNHGDYDFWVVKLSSFNGITALNNSSQTLLYPNPASNYFTIESTSFERQLLQVYDITGKLVITKYLEPGKNNIDCDGFNNGIYNLHISSNEFPVNKRLMIIR